jgi:hypothetical protein
MLTVLVSETAPGGVRALVFRLSLPRTNIGGHDRSDQAYAPLIPIQINAIALKEGDARVIQGTAYDIVAHTFDVESIPRAFAGAVGVRN